MYMLMMRSLGLSLSSEISTGFMKQEKPAQITSKIQCFDILLANHDLQELRYDHRLLNTLDRIFRFL